MLGVGYAQMALAASLLHENIIAANPITVVSSILRLGVRYLRPCLVASIALVLTGLGVWGLLYKMPSMWMEAVALWGFWVIDALWRDGHAADDGTDLPRSRPRPVLVPAQATVGVVAASRADLRQFVMCLSAANRRKNVNWATSGPVKPPFPFDRSKRIHAPFAAMFGVADQPLSLGIDDPVECLERDLSDSSDRTRSYHDQRVPAKPPWNGTIVRKFGTVQARFKATWLRPDGTRLAPARAPARHRAGTGGQGPADWSPLEFADLG